MDHSWIFDQLIVVIQSKKVPNLLVDSQSEYFEHEKPTATDKIWFEHIVKPIISLKEIFFGNFTHHYANEKKFINSDSDSDFEITEKEALVHNQEW